MQGSFTDKEAPVAEFRIVKVDRLEDQVLKNLLEHYLHDMAQWFGFDSLEDGSYSYSTDHIWDEGLDVFLTYANLIPIGFAIVGSGESWVGDKNARDLDEFFVVRKYRRKGVGLKLAEHVWNLYPGRWVVRVFQRNVPALPFWRVAVSGYTGGSYAEEVCEVDERDWSYFTFATPDPLVG